MLVVLAVAVVMASLASLGVYMAIRSRPAVQVEVPSSFVVVARQPLEMGALLTPEQVRVVAWPARDPVVGAYDKAESVVNRGLIASVVENEPITEAKLAPLQGGSGLPTAIRSGMRAMAVKVNEVIGVAGFVLPGTKVDVLVTIPRDNDSITRVVASNVQVLATGERFDEIEAKKEGKPIRSTVVTLMVTPPDAERIALATTEGQIMLALRNPLDTEITRTAGVRTAALTEGTIDTPRPAAATRSAAPRPLRPAVSPAANVTPPPPLPRPRTVETIKAGKREMEIIP